MRINNFIRSSYKTGKYIINIIRAMEHIRPINLLKIGDQSFFIKFRKIPFVYLLIQRETEDELSQWIKNLEGDQLKGK